MVKHEFELRQQRGKAMGVWFWTDVCEPYELIAARLRVTARGHGTW